MLGLNATISNHPYEVTAEMMEPGQANFIPSDALLKFLHDYGEVALRVAQQLSHNYYSAHEEIDSGINQLPGAKVCQTAAGFVCGTGRFETFSTPAFGGDA